MLSLNRFKPTISYFIGFAILKLCGQRGDAVSKYWKYFIRKLRDKKNFNFIV